MKKLMYQVFALTFTIGLYSCSQTQVLTGSTEKIKYSAGKPIAQSTVNIATQPIAEIGNTQREVSPAPSAVVAHKKMNTPKVSERLEASAQQLAEKMKVVLSNTSDARVTSALQNNIKMLEGIDMTGKRMNLQERLNLMIYRKLLDKTYDKLEANMDTADILAICSLSCGAAAALFYGGFLFGPAAIALGVVALKKGTSRRGMAIAGIALGAFFLLWWILWIAVWATVWF